MSAARRVSSCGRPRTVSSPFIPSGADLLLDTGNAGGLEIIVGGRKAPSLGPTGLIRRGIPLEAEQLLSGAN